MDRQEADLVMSLTTASSPAGLGRCGAADRLSVALPRYTFFRRQWRG